MFYPEAEADRELFSELVPSKICTALHPCLVFILMVSQMQGIVLFIY